VSVYYWQRAVAAIDKKRLEVAFQPVPEDPDDPIWKEVERLAWLEDFAHASMRMAEEAEIF
jgi:hypothetical protein